MQKGGVTITIELDMDIPSIVLREQCCFPIWLVFIRSMNKRHDWWIIYFIPNHRFWCHLGLILWLATPTGFLVFSSSIIVFVLTLHVDCIITSSFAAAEREAVSAAEKEERKVQLRDKVSYFVLLPGSVSLCFYVLVMCH